MTIEIKKVFNIDRNANKRLCRIVVSENDIVTDIGEKIFDMTDVIEMLEWSNNFENEVFLLK